VQTVCAGWTDVIRLIVVIGAVVTMIFGLRLVFNRLKEEKQGFGPNSLKAIGMILFIPTLIIIGVAVADFQKETLAALLGTVAGYVLSRSKDES
jgi:glucose uptake protein GlcU